MSIRRLLPLVLVSVLALAASRVPAADEPPVAPSPEAGQPVIAGNPANQAGPEAPGAADDPARAALRAELDALLVARQARVQALAAQLAAASGDEAAALQRRIEQEKAAGDRELLQWQLDRATAAGDAARRRTLEAALAAWDAPPPAPIPVDRPVPSDPAR